MHSTAYKKQGAPDRRPLTQKKLRLFTCVALRTKSKGLPIGDPVLSKFFFSFYTRSTTYKKARGSRSAVPYSVKNNKKRKSMLFTRVAPRKKSKELLIGGPHIFYYFQHVLHHVQKVRGSIGMCSKFIILLIKFPRNFFCRSAGVIIP
jgi:hypothetical protein